MSISTTRREFIKTSALTTAGALAGGLAITRPAQAAVNGDHVYKVAGKCRIKLDVMGAAAGSKRPAVMWLHGGALICGNRWVNPRDLFSAKLLARGYVIVSIDYRLAPETKLPAIIEDVQDAWRWIHEEGSKLYGIDHARLATAGNSAGGYLTLMTGFCLNPRPRALVSYYGYGDITTPWYSQPYEFYRRGGLISKQDALKSVTTTPLSEEPIPNSRWRFYMYCRQNGIWPKEVSGHDPASEPRWFDRYCPIRNVTAKYSPTLLIHGTNDKDVPYSESENMAARLKAAGVEHEFITVPGAGHGLDGAKPEELDRIAERAVQFVQSHTA